MTWSRRARGRPAAAAGTGGISFAGHHRARDAASVGAAAGDLAAVLSRHRAWSPRPRRRRRPRIGCWPRSSPWSADARPAVLGAVADRAADRRRTAATRRAGAACSPAGSCGRRACPTGCRGRVDARYRVFGPGATVAPRCVLAIADDHSGWSDDPPAGRGRAVGLGGPRARARPAPARTRSGSWRPRWCAGATGADRRRRPRCGLDRADDAGRRRHRAGRVPAVIERGAGRPARALRSIGPAGDEVLPSWPRPTRRAWSRRCGPRVALVAPALGPHAAADRGQRRGDAVPPACSPRSPRPGRRSRRGRRRTAPWPDRIACLERCCSRRCRPSCGGRTATRVLGPLLEHDRAHRTDLVTTLRDLPRLLRIVGTVRRADAPARQHAAVPGRADRGAHRPRPAPAGRPGRPAARPAAPALASWRQRQSLTT